jgi:hypothetical protein
MLVSREALLAPFCDFWRSPFPATRTECLRALYRVVEEAGKALAPPPGAAGAGAAGAGVAGPFVAGAGVAVAGVAGAVVAVCCRVFLVGCVRGGGQL